MVSFSRKARLMSLFDQASNHAIFGKKTRLFNQSSFRFVWVRRSTPNFVQFERRWWKWHVGSSPEQNSFHIMSNFFSLFQHFVCSKCEKPFLGHRHYEKKGLAYCETHYHQVLLQSFKLIYDHDFKIRDDLNGNNKKTTVKPGYNDCLHRTNQFLRPESLEWKIPCRKSGYEESPS